MRVRASSRLLLITNILGVIVTGTHQARRTGSASANDPAGSLASAAQAAVKALVAFPLLVRSACTRLPQFTNA